MALSKNQVRVAEISEGKIFGHEDVIDYYLRGSRSSSNKGIGCTASRNSSDCSEDKDGYFERNERILSAATKGESICTLLCAEVSTLL